MMINNIVNSPFFGITILILLYFVSYRIHLLSNKNPILNPLLISIILGLLLIKFTGISYENIEIGGKYITFFIAPATVALVINLYKNIDLLKKNIIPVFVGVFVGSIVCILSVFALSKLFSLDRELIITLLPKSLTTAIGATLADEFGGSGDITTIAIIITGVTGAVIAPTTMKMFKIDDPLAQGIGIGTSAHAVGTSKAIEMGEVQGAMSGLSIALAGFISVLIMPILISILL